MREEIEQLEKENSEVYESIYNKQRIDSRLLFHPSLPNPNPYPSPNIFTIEPSPNLQHPPCPLLTPNSYSPNIFLAPSHQRNQPPVLPPPQSHPPYLPSPVYHYHSQHYFPSPPIPAQANPSAPIYQNPSPSLILPSPLSPYQANPQRIPPPSPILRNIAPISPRPRDQPISSRSPQDFEIDIRMYDLGDEAVPQSYQPVRPQEIRRNRPGRNLNEFYGVFNPNIDEMTYEEIAGLEEMIGNVSSGLNQYELNSLGAKAYNLQEENDCSICLSELKMNEKFIHLKCKHLFHEKCIKDWLKTKNQCPICKKEAVKKRRY
jgi:hypothetical protein